MTQNKVNTGSLFVKWLEKPYVLNNSLTYKLLISIVMGLVCYLYLTFFKPFATVKNTNNLQLHAKEVGFIVTFVLLFYYFVVRRLFPVYFNPKTWTIGGHIYVVMCLMLTGCSVFLLYQKYSEYLGYDDFIGEKTLANITYYVFSVGFVPLSIYLFIDERYGAYQTKKIKRTKEQKKSKKAKRKLPENEQIIEQQPNKIEILSYNEKESISFAINNLVYIASERNYANFFILENEQLQEYSIRQTLSKIQEQLQEHPNVVRCHKSYLVNLKYVLGYDGDSPNYFLQLHYTNNEIPVSRSFNVKELLIPV